jgi:nitroreductase
VGLSTVGWREAWKYGERAYRYCQLDTGHAIAALYYAATLLGWRVAEQRQVGTATLASVLGLDRAQDFPARKWPETESEEAEVLLALSWNRDVPAPIDPGKLREAARTTTWNGLASTIDPHPMYRWPIVGDITVATRAPDGPGDASPPRPDRPAARASVGHSLRSAADVILGRRSAQRFDSRHWLERRDFFGLLERLGPDTQGPWDVLGRRHRLDLLLLVHRIIGLDAGLYLLNRAPPDASSLTIELASRFDLSAVEETPPGVDLRRIVSVESRALARAARSLHCQQDIAAQACFALGMLAELDSAIEQASDGYRSIHREAGALGHVLYLEAEALGLRATGIGCFLDDSVHDLLRLEGTRRQTLYHVAVGRAIEDTRIESAPGALVQLSGGSGESVS